MVVNESEALRWVTRQWQRLNGKDEILGVAECCESFTRTDVTGKTIPDSRSCRAKTWSTKRDVRRSNRETVMCIYRGINVFNLVAFSGQITKK